MIKSFGNELAETIFDGAPLSRKQAKAFPPDLYQKARLKLNLLNASPTLESLYFPPSNRFESLSGTLAGYYSIRIPGSPWRIVFRWEDGDSKDVQIMDYH